MILYKRTFFIRFPNTIVGTFFKKTINKTETYYQYGINLADQRICFFYAFLI